MVPSTSLSSSTSTSSLEKTDREHRTAGIGISMADEIASDATLPVDEDVPKRSKAKTIVIMAALNLAMFLAALDTTIITTALPKIAELFDISDAGYAWVGSAYLLSNSASIPAWGNVSNIYGRKPILLAANGVFIVGSIVSALSKSMEMLIAGRAVQGLGGGGIVTMVNIAVSDIFAERERGLYYGLVGAVWAIASALGPVLGGVFAEKATWQWCFWVNLPLDFIVVLILILWLDVHNPKTPFWAGIKAIDWLGAITMAGATVMLLLGLQFGGVQYSWGSATVICLIVFGVVMFSIFYYIQYLKLVASPIIPFDIFGRLTNCSALFVCFCDAFVFNSVAYFVPLYFQTVLAASPLDAGVWMLALAIPLAIISGSAGYIMDKTGGFRELLQGGLILMTIGVGLCINFPAYVSWPRIIMFLIITGVGMGPNFMAPMMALQAHLPGKDVAAGTATFNWIRQLAGAFGVVLGQVIFQGQMQGHLTSMLDAGVPATLAEELAKGSAVAITGVLGHDADLPAVRQAKTESFSKMWILYTVVSFIGLLASLGIKKKELSEEHVETRTGIPSESRNPSTAVVSVTSEKNGERGEVRSKEEA